MMVSQVSRQESTRRLCLKSVKLQELHPFLDSACQVQTLPAQFGHG